MFKSLLNRSGVLLIPILLILVLAIFSLTIGWNFATLFLFWFILTPILAIRIPSILSKAKNSIMESLSGLILFYVFMVLMIYSHYQTDYFKIMIISCLINMVVIFLTKKIHNTIAADVLK